jgi:hypothetical protein
VRQTVLIRSRHVAVLRLLRSLSAEAARGEDAPQRIIHHNEDDSIWITGASGALLTARWRQAHYCDMTAELIFSNQMADAVSSLVITWARLPFKADMRELAPVCPLSAIS